MLTREQMMENRNYWNDSRTINSMITHDSFFIKESKTEIDLNWVQAKWLEHTEGDYVEGTEKIEYGKWLMSMNVDTSKQVRCISRYELCYQCEGSGTMVNPSIDCKGLSSEDFERDHDFRDNYMSGVYNITCSTCHGKKELRIQEYETENPLYNWCNERLAEHYEFEYEFAREIAAERAMGC